MALQVRIESDKLNDFSSCAKEELIKQVKKYSNNIINESNRIEESGREDGAVSEITGNMVLQAVKKTVTANNKKISKPLLYAKIISSLSLLLTGFFFDSDGYNGEIIKFIAFIVFLIVACVSTVLQFVFEGKE